MQSAEHDGVVEVATGIHRIGHAHTNAYLVESDDGLVLVDTGLPGSWRRTRSAVESGRLGATTVSSIVLTHGHFDHVGNAARAHRRWGAPVLVHADDMRLSAHPYRYDHESSRIGPPLRHPASWPLLARMTVAGALMVPGLYDHVSRAEPGSSAAALSEIPTAPAVDPIGQIPHWLFAFDSAGIAMRRALAAIATHPDLERRAVDEAAGSTATPIWPTTPAMRTTPTGSIRTSGPTDARPSVRISSRSARDPRGARGRTWCCSSPARSSRACSSVPGSP